MNLIRISIHTIAIGVVFAASASAQPVILDQVQVVNGVDGLNGAVSVTVSPDGAHAYAAANESNALTIISRDATTGVLTFVDVVRDGFGGVDGLDSVVSVQVSPDGAHVYAAGASDDALAIFGRDGATGLLTFLGVVRDGVNGVDGLRNPNALTISSDGAHVYATAFVDNALTVFGRDAGTGLLTFIEVTRDGVNGVDGLDGANAVVVSPDGAHVYTAGSDDSALTVFSRDTETGALTFVEVLRDGVDGVDGLSGVEWVTVSPDGAHVYGAGLLDNALAIFSRDAVTGKLTFVELVQNGVDGVEGLLNPISVAVSPVGTRVYVAGIGENTLTSFDRNLSTGDLTFVEVVRDGVMGVDGLDGVIGVAVSPDDEHVYTASAVDDAIAVFGDDAGGIIPSFIEVVRDGVNGVDGLRNANSVTVSPDGAHVYVAGALDDALAVFSRDANSGALTFVEVIRDGVNGVDGLETAFSVTVSPDGAHVYAAGASDNALAVFSRNAVTGALAFVEVVRDGLNGVDGLLTSRSVTVSPDGAHVYAGGSGDNALAIFSRDAGTGVLTFVGEVRDGINGVDGLAEVFSVTVSPDGSHVYAASFGENALAVFSRNAGSGLLTFVEVIRDGINGVDGLERATSVTVSPEGRHLYVTGFEGNALSVFGRDVGTGALTFIEVIRDGVGGIDGLMGATSVTVSPDGDHVYVTGLFDDAFAIFSRNADTGALSFAEVSRDGVNGVDGLNGAVSVVVSPDGAHVYVAGNEDHAVASFRRGVGTGDRTFLQVVRDEVNGVDGLGDPLSVAVSPDGAHVYAAGATDDALAVFRRDTGTGVLSFVEVVRDGVDDVDGLDQALSVVVSPDGAHVYVAGQLDQSVAVFSRNAITGVLTFVEKVREGVDGVDGLVAIQSVNISPDGKNVYATGSVENTLAVFSRNLSTGTLTFVEVFRDGLNGVDGLAAAYSTAVSPDGAHVYVSGANDAALAVFSRNGSTGALTFLEVVRVGVNGVDGLFGALSVMVSPDGAHVYAAGAGDNALAVFSRNASSGLLTFVEVVRDGVNGVDGLLTAYSVVVSPDGSHVYAAGQGDDAVAVFSRDAFTGKLTYVGVLLDGVNGVDGLLGTSAVTVSPDGANLYVAGLGDDAIAVFGLDADRDGLSYAEEILAGTDPFNPDSDDDGLLDGFEVRFGLNPRSGADGGSIDSDGDFLTNGEEEELSARYPVDPKDGSFPPTDWYVSALIGDDGNSALEGGGSQGMPWRTIGKAMSELDELARVNFPVRVLLDDSSNVNDGVLGPIALYEESVGLISFATVEEEDVADGQQVHIRPDSTGSTPVIEGAADAVLKNVIVRPALAPDQARALLEINNVAMTVDGVIFDGLLRQDSTGIDISGGGSSDSLIRQCSLINLGTGIVSTNSAVAVSDNVFNNIAANGIASRAIAIGFTVFPGKGGGSTPVIGAADRIIETGFNRFRGLPVGASAIQFVNVPTEQTSAEYNDWGVYTEAEILARISAPVKGVASAIDVLPFVTEEKQFLPGTITGVVLDGTTNTPVALSKMPTGVLLDPAATASADENGLFVFDSLVAGGYTVSAIADGFDAPTAVSVNVGSGGVEVAPRFLLGGGGGAGPEDLNGDNTVNSQDIQLVINVVLGLGGVGDVNSDGVTNAQDIQLVINRVLGL